MENPLKMIRGVASIAATWFFFLIFAQFAFLEWLADVGLSHASRPIMGAMGLAGFVASLWTSRLLARHAAVSLMRVGFLACALAAIVTPFVSNLLGLMVVSAFIGLGLGALTVSLAAGLTGLTGLNHFGLQTGLGAGIAYLACNIPAIFQASPNQQAFMAAGACVLGFLLNLADAPYREKPARPRAWPMKWAAFVAVLLAFTILIWMDSGLFYVIQHTPQYKAATWSGWHLWLNGFIHFAFAVLAGWLIDRGALWSLLVGACLLLCAGAGLLLDGSGHPLSSTLYSAGVSLYSAVLVAWPSLNPRGDLSIRKRAGWLYGIAGWVGSALGIGMVQDLHRIPLWFLVLASLSLLAVWAWYERNRRIQGLLSLLILVGATMSCQVHADRLEEKTVLPSAERGMQVYLAEGCINCHSQYVRPETRDELWWGPYQSPESLQESRPPLFGNRRQGPDLLNVGNRRSLEWNRVHLKEPRLLNPGTTMPPFAHLFADNRGEDLLAYIQSLGSDTIQTRMDQVYAWQPASYAIPVSFGKARKLFKNNCAACHGDLGLGNGPASARLSHPVRNLRQDAFRFANSNDPVALARVIKFGVMGTNMPGHETLSDQEVLGLAYLIRDWRVRR